MIILLSPVLEWSNGWEICFFMHKQHLPQEDKCTQESHQNIAGLQSAASQVRPKTMGGGGVSAPHATFATRFPRTARVSPPPKTAPSERKPCGDKHGCLVRVRCPIPAPCAGGLGQVRGRRTRPRSQSTHSGGYVSTKRCPRWCWPAQSGACGANEHHLEDLIGCAWLPMAWGILPSSLIGHPTTAQGGVVAPCATFTAGCLEQV